MPEYFIDSNHPGASDSNDGSAGRPWKTLRRAIHGPTLWDRLIGWIKKVSE